MTTINRRKLRAKLGSRSVRRQGTKHTATGPLKDRPAKLVAEMVREELAKKAAQ